MTDYSYTKTNVNVSTLRYEIAKSGSIETAFSGATFDSPESLIVSFVSSLTAGEKTALDVIVNLHSGGILYRYRLLCEVCQEYLTCREPQTPIVCPICSSSQIDDVVQQESFQGVRALDGTKWRYFLPEQATPIIAKDAE